MARTCFTSKEDVAFACEGGHGVPEANAFSDVHLRQHCIWRERLFEDLSTTDMEERVEWACANLPCG